MYSRNQNTERSFCDVRNQCRLKFKVSPRDPKYALASSKFVSLSYFRLIRGPDMTKSLPRVPKKASPGVAAACVLRSLPSNANLNTLATSSIFSSFSHAHTLERPIQHYLDMSEQSRPKKLLSSISAELGLSSLFQAPLDTKILCLQRFIRLFAYGASTLILATYMSELGHDSALIGLFMTLTLVGDVVMSFCLTLVADQVGRRRILALGAALMVGSGIVFAVSENYYVLLAAAILGVITPR